jgi:hypothetical protein
MTMDPARDEKRARRTLVLALAHVGLVILILGAFVYTRMHAQ